jgi:hypothetical protein
MEGGGRDKPWVSVGGESVLVRTADCKGSSSDGVAFHTTRSTAPRLFLILTNELTHSLMRL